VGKLKNINTTKANMNMINKKLNIKNDTGITPKLVAHIAELAHLPLTNEKQTNNLVEAFKETLGVIKNLKEVDTSSIEPTYQVTGLENILREDVVDEKRMFTQKEALQNAPIQYQGYFVVPQVLDQD
jgi:aspartyl/glutamyl-tRNA(Asn/Gln) amidotransferase C subunit